MNFLIYTNVINLDVKEVKLIPIDVGVNTLRPYLSEDRTIQLDEGMIVQPINSISIILEGLSDVRFFLKDKIEIRIDATVDGYILSNENLNVHVFGRTIEIALQEWQKVLINLYLSYKDTPDDQLTQSGKGLKAELQTTVGERNGN